MKMEESEYTTLCKGIADATMPTFLPQGFLCLATRIPQGTVTVQHTSVSRILRRYVIKPAIRERYESGTRDWRFLACRPRVAQQESLKPKKIAVLTGQSCQRKTKARGASDGRTEARLARYTRRLSRSRARGKQRRSFARSFAVLLLCSSSAPAGPPAFDF